MTAPLHAPVRRALLSVSDKAGIVEFARELAKRGVELLSTGGTYKLLRESGLAEIEVSSHTGFPEIMDGRVKTLHPKIHGGLLGRRDVDSDVMQQHGIAETGRAHVCTPVTNARLVCRHMLETKQK